MCSRLCEKKNHPGQEHVQCSAKTKRGSKCSLHADRVGEDGRMLCHTHDPAGKFRANVEEARALRAELKANGPSEKQASALPYQEGICPGCDCLIVDFGSAAKVRGQILHVGCVS